MTLRGCVRKESLEDGGLGAQAAEDQRPPRMSYRFFRRLRIAPGLTVNLSKSGPSLSVGGRGGHVTLGGSRGRRTTIGLPGTGLYWTTVHRQTRARGRGSVAESEAAPSPISGTPRAVQRLTLSFFRRLVTPADEQAFVDGCRALVVGDHGTALAHLRAAPPTSQMAPSWPAVGPSRRARSRKRKPTSRPPWWRRTSSAARLIGTASQRP